MLVIVLQELKLNSLMAADVEALGELLHRLAADIHCPLYVEHYARDLPRLFAANTQRTFIPVGKYITVQQM